MSINFYNTIKKSKGLANPFYEKHHIDMPFRMIIAAPSGSGKTHSLCRLIYEMGEAFHYIYICVLSSDEPLYNMIIDRLPDGKVQIFEKGEIPNLEEFSTKDPKTGRLKKNDNLSRLIVFDDLMLHKGANKLIEEYYIKGRKLGFSMVYIAQNYYAIPRNIRLNAQFFILGRNILTRDIKDILRIFSIDMELKDFTHLYNCLTQQPLDTIMINVDKKLIQRNISEHIYNVSNKAHISETLASIEDDECLPDNHQQI